MIDGYALSAQNSEGLVDVYVPNLKVILHGFRPYKAVRRGVNVLRVMSTVVSRKMLDNLTVKAGYTPAAYYLALTTVAVVVGDTGSTITEATYTGYGRKAIVGADWNSASGSAPATTATNTAEVFAACTAGSSTVIGWAGCSAITAGDVLQFGTATSVTISTTQTPPTVPSGGLVHTMA